jgi:hypothetical protein
MALEKINSNVIPRTQLTEEARRRLDNLNRLGTPKDITSIRLKETGNKSLKELDSYNDRAIPDYRGRNLDIYA